MNRPPVRPRQADVARAIRAAKQAGAGSVRILLDGTIAIALQPEPAGEKTDIEVDDGREVVL